MKKIILLLFILIPLNSIKAQNESGSPNSHNPFIGIKGGYGIVAFMSNIKGIGNFAEKTYNNYTGGIVAGYNFTTRISLQVEGNFAHYGARNIDPTYIYSPQSPVLQNYNSNSTIDRVDMHLYNADIPLIIQISLKQGGLTPYFYAGLNLGINLFSSTTIVRKMIDSDSYRENKDDITPRIIYNEFAPVFGAGFKKNSGKLVFFGDLRFKYGYKNLSNVDNNLGFTNSAIWLSAGVLYNFL